MKKTLLFIAIISCIIIGCKLDESGFTQNSINNKDTKPLLTGMWLVKSQITASGPVLRNDTITAFTAKDYYLFNSNNSFSHSSHNPDTLITGQYTYNTSSQRLALDTAAKNIYTVSKLTTDSLIMYATINGAGSGQVIVNKITYKLARK